MNKQHTMESESETKLESALINRKQDEEIHTQLSVLKNTSTSSNNIENIDNITAGEMGITLECSVAIGHSIDMNPFPNCDNENQENSSESERVNLKRKRSPINNATDIDPRNQPSTSKLQNFDEVNKKRRIEPQSNEPVAHTSSSFIEYVEQPLSPDLAIPSTSSSTALPRTTSLMDSILNESVEADDVFIMELIRTFTNKKLSVDDKNRMFEMCSRTTHQPHSLADAREISLNLRRKLRLIKNMLFKCPKCRRTLDLMNSDPSKIPTNSHSLFMHVKKQHLIKNYNKFNRYYLKVVRGCGKFWETRVPTEQLSSDDDVEDNVAEESSSETLPIDYLTRSEDNSATVINRENVNSSKSPTENVIVSINLYRPGTNVRKSFDEIIADYKKITSMKDLSNIQLTDILMAYKDKIGVGVNNSVINDLNTYFEAHILPGYSKNSIDADHITNQPIRLSQYSESSSSKIINKKPLHISDFDFSDMDDEADEEQIPIVGNSSKKNTKTTNIPTVAEISVNQIEIEQNLSHSCVPKVSTICTQGVEKNTRTTNENNLEKNVMGKKTENKNILNNDITDNHVSDIIEDNCNIPIIEKIIPVNDYTTTTNIVDKQVNDKESPNVSFVEGSRSVDLYDTEQNCMDVVIENEKFNDGNQTRNNTIDSNGLKENFNVPFVKETCSVAANDTKQNVTNEVIENEEFNDSIQTPNNNIDSDINEKSRNVPFVKKTTDVTSDIEENIMANVIESDVDNVEEIDHRVSTIDNCDISTIEENIGLVNVCTTETNTAEKQIDDKRYNNNNDYQFNDNIDSNITEGSSDVSFIKKTTSETVHDIEENIKDNAIENKVVDSSGTTDDHTLSVINCDIPIIENIASVDVVTNTETDLVEHQINNEESRSSDKTPNDIIDSNVNEESFNTSFVEETTSIGVYDIDENAMDTNTIENENINNSGAMSRRCFSALTDGDCDMPIIENVMSVDVHTTVTMDMARKQIDTEESHSSSSDKQHTDIIDSDINVNEMPRVLSSFGKITSVAVPSYDVNENTMDNVIQNEEYNNSNETADDNDMNSGNIEDIFNIPLVDRITQMNLYGDIGKSVVDEPMKNEKLNIIGSNVGEQNFSASPTEKRVTANDVYGIATDERAAEYHRTFDNNKKIVSNRCVIESGDTVRGIFGVEKYQSPMKNTVTPANMYDSERNAVDKSYGNDPGEFNDIGKLHNDILLSSDIEDIFDIPLADQAALLYGYNVQEDSVVVNTVDGARVAENNGFDGGLTSLPAAADVVSSDSVVKGGFGIPLIETTTSSANMTYDFVNGNNNSGLTGTGKIENYGGIATGHIINDNDVVVQINRDVPMTVKTAHGYDNVGVGIRLSTAAAAAAAAMMISDGIENGAYGYGNKIRDDMIMIDPITAGDNIEDIFSIPLMVDDKTVDFVEMMAEAVHGDRMTTTSVNEPAADGEEAATGGGDTTIDLTNDDTTGGGDTTIDLTDDDTTIVYYLDNSSDDDVCTIMLNVVKKNESYFRFMLMCSDSEELVSQLHEAGIQLPVNENCALDKANFVKIYMKWFEGGHGDPGREYDRWSIGVLKNMIWYMRQRDAMPENVRRANEYETNTALNFLYKSWGNTATRPKPTANYFKRLMARSTINNNGGFCSLLPGDDDDNDNDNDNDNDGDGAAYRQYGSYEPGRNGGKFRSERAPPDYCPTYSGLIGEDRIGNDVVYEDISDGESDTADDDDNGGQRMAAASIDGGKRMAAAASFDGGKRMAAASLNGGKRMSAASFDGGKRMSAAASFDGGKRMSAASFDGGKRMAAASFDGGKRMAATSFDGGKRMAAAAYDDGQRMVAAASFDGGQRMAVAAYDDGQRTAMSAFDGDCGQRTAVATAFDDDDDDNDDDDVGGGSPVLPQAATTAAFYQAVADAIGDCDDDSNGTVNQMLDNNLNFQHVVNNIKTEVADEPLMMMSAECQQLVNYAEDDDDGMISGGFEIPDDATVAATNDNIMSTIGFDNAGMLLP